MIPIIFFVGASGSGKTTLLEKIISEFTAQGILVGALKNSHHNKLEFDKPGKDSYRFREAGATAVVAVTDTMLVSVRSISSVPSPNAFLSYFEGVDLLLVEGFKESHLPKIEVWRKANSPSPILQNDPNLIAVVTDDPIQTTVPVFSFSDLEKIIFFLKNRFLSAGILP